MPAASVDILACSHPPDEWPLSKLKLKPEKCNWVLVHTLCPRIHSGFLWG